MRPNDSVVRVDRRKQMIIPEPASDDQVLPALTPNSAAQLALSKQFTLPLPILNVGDELANQSLLLWPVFDLRPSELLGKRIYSGFGVVGRQGVSENVPFDILSMIIVAEKARRAVVGSGITFLIADTHASVTGDYDPQAIDRAADWRETIVYRACDSLGVPDPQVFRASAIEQDDLYRSLLQTVTLLGRSEGEYFIREACDLEFFRRANGIGAKIGWSLTASSRKPGRFDERAFDNIYKEIFSEGNEMAFLYATAGRTLDPKRQQAAPYLDFSPDKRVLLTAQQNIATKL